MAIVDLAYCTKSLRFSHVLTPNNKGINILFLLFSFSFKVDKAIYLKIVELSKKIKLFVLKTDLILVSHFRTKTPTSILYFTGLGVDQSPLDTGRPLKQSTAKCQFNKSKHWISTRAPMRSLDFTSYDSSSNLIIKIHNGAKQITPKLTCKLVIR